MAGNTSAIQMASNALVLLGHPPIASFNEPGAGAQAASNLYETTYRDLLEGSRWRFATKKEASLSKLATAPVNEYSYQYQLPTDLLYLIRTIDGQDYEIYEDKLFSNNPSVSIDYIYRINEDMIPAYFAKVVEFQLASLMAVPVTANSTRAEFYENKYEKQLKKARYLDASQRPADEFQNYRYTRY